MSRKRRERANRAHRSQNRRLTRKTAYATLAAAVGLLAAWLAIRPVVRQGEGSTQGDAIPVRADRPVVPRGEGSTAGDPIVVRADMAGFRPTVIRAKAGERITVRLVSLDNQFHVDGGGRHQFAIDELGVNVIAPSLGSKDATFVVPEPGEYAFYCSICCGGKANPNMWGRLIVEA